MIDLMVGDYHQAAFHSDECMRTAVTPFERKMGAITKASAEIFVGDVQERVVDLLEAIRAASDAGWELMVIFGATFAGVGHVLSGRISVGTQLLESAVKTYDARGADLPATFNKIPLAEIYLEMLTSRARPPLSVILRNLGTILRIKLFGMRRIKVLLEQAARAPHLDERGVTRARINMNIGLLHKLKKEPNLARQYLQKARAPAEHHGAALLVAKIDAALAELH